MIQLSLNQIQLIMDEYEHVTRMNLKYDQQCSSYWAGRLESIKKIIEILKLG